MRTLRLAQVAAEAEVVRLKRLASRTVTRVVYGLIALIFLVAVLVGIHVTLAIWLLPQVGAMYATLIVLAGDLAITIVFGLLAALSGPGALEREAYTVRETARLQLVQAAATASMIAPMARLLGNRSIFRLAMAALMAKMFTNSAKR